MLRGWVGHITTKARMPEWSKGVDLRPTIVKPMRVFKSRFAQYLLYMG